MKFTYFPNDEMLFLKYKVLIGIIVNMKNHEHAILIIIFLKACSLVLYIHHKNI